MIHRTFGCGQTLRLSAPIRGEEALRPYGRAAACRRSPPTTASNDFSHALDRGTLRIIKQVSVAEQLSLELGVAQQCTDQRQRGSAARQLAWRSCGVDRECVSQGYGSGFADVAPCPSLSSTTWGHCPPLLGEHEFTERAALAAVLRGFRRAVAAPVPRAARHDRFSAWSSLPAWSMSPVPRSMSAHLAASNPRPYGAAS